MNLDVAEVRARLHAARVARLATVSGAGEPHVVPITFAVEGDVLYFAVDHKPKSTMNLRRLRNISQNPRVSVLVDHYSDDWSVLWWVRADGRADVWEQGRQRTDALALLTAKYPQYRENAPAGPVVAITIHQVTGWSYSD